MIFIDADLKGLTSSHIKEMVLPLLEGRLDMNIGVLDRGRIFNAVNLFFEAPFSGTRALKRDVWNLLPPKIFPSKWEPERILKHVARKHKLSVGMVTLYGIRHYAKEEKLGFWQGFWRRLGMISRIGLTMVWLAWLKLKG